MDGTLPRDCRCKGDMGTFFLPELPGKGNQNIAVHFFTGVTKK